MGGFHNSKLCKKVISMWSNFRKSDTVSKMDILRAAARIYCAGPLLPGWTEVTELQPDGEEKVFYTNGIRRQPERPTKLDESSSGDEVFPRLIGIILKASQTE